MGDGQKDRTDNDKVAKAVFFLGRIITLCGRTVSVERSSVIFVHVNTDLHRVRLSSFITTMPKSFS